jgi:hypothetical protein
VLLKPRPRRLHNAWTGGACVSPWLQQDRSLTTWQQDILRPSLVTSTTCSATFKVLHQHPVVHASGLASGAPPALTGGGSCARRFKAVLSVSPATPRSGAVLVAVSKPALKRISSSLAVLAFCCWRNQCHAEDPQHYLRFGGRTGSWRVPMRRRQARTFRWSPIAGRLSRGLKLR